jgi:hypothetical protein
LRAEPTQEIKDLMMGHVRASARKHYAYDDVTIKEVYQRAFEHLSINGIQTREDLVKIKEDNAKTQAELKAFIGSQTVQMEQMKRDHEKDKLEMLSTIADLKTELIGKILELRESDFLLTPEQKENIKANWKRTLDQEDKQ